jgi:hypothetical protein
MIVTLIFAIEVEYEILILIIFGRCWHRVEHSTRPMDSSALNILDPAGAAVRGTLLLRRRRAAARPCWHGGAGAGRTLLLLQRLVVAAAARPPPSSRSTLLARRPGTGLTAPADLQFRNPYSVQPKKKFGQDWARAQVPIRRM